MSYARWGVDGSEVYVFAYGGPDVPETYWTCLHCRLTPGPVIVSHTTDTAREMFNHLVAHRLAGHVVPQRAFDCLAKEILDGS
jgi:hypothetical protein